ncbi:hypothetical protein [Pseudomonas aeruginosa]|uniref:hypothetical protein n=1 Tax=Pseudomonas TaxID=286 RepID=UPI0015F9D46B|nr:hypothetical protein [Pseudomonas aeruginosa]ELD5775042.1 hypothetical protein [Pseudomonas aeruginosa]ELK4908461.1 hypothetical protein [Pseudomonas aeruginosa]MBA6427007.1 hypothetical protein [Pseudomonas aeruginosa]MBX5886669.1 hypothetical protein [Pseudomonas aeruginosa]MDU9380436.1 hypothetical protein [Pseudomonas aeruginosa]
MITDSDFHYADWLLIEWARWVKSEFMGTSLDKKASVRSAPILDDETGLAVDRAISRCDQSTRKIIKRVYLWQDISIEKSVLRRYISDFMGAYYRDVA